MKPIEVTIKSKKYYWVDTIYGGPVLKGQAVLIDMLSGNILVEEMHRITVTREGLNKVEKLTKGSQKDE